MATCSRCGKTGLFIRVNTESGLCMDCVNKDNRIRNTLLSSGRKACFFRNGVLYDVMPRNTALSLYDDRQKAYDNDSVIVSDGDIFDPADLATLNNLHIPQFSPIKGSMPDVTADLSYILKMRCEQLQDKQYASQFIQTTLYMMNASPIGWSRSDFLRVILVFYELGMFREGDLFESVYRKNNPLLFSSPFGESDEGRHLILKYYYESRWYKYREHEELKRLVPDLTPDTYKGFAQIRGRKTNRYISLIEKATSLGYVFNEHMNQHYCRKQNAWIKMETKYDTAGKSPRLVYCECPYHSKGECSGKNEFDLLCVYPSTGNKKVIFSIGSNPESVLSVVFNYALKNRIVDSHRLSKDTGLSEISVEKALNQLNGMEILYHPELSMLYYIAITTEEAVEKYGQVIDEQI